MNDEELGRFLRDETPDPGPGYWEEIDRRLEAAAEGGPADDQDPRDDRDTDAEVIRLTDMTTRPRSRFSDLGPLLAVAAAMLIVVTGVGFLLARGGDDGLTEVATDEGTSTDPDSDDAPDREGGSEADTTPVQAVIRWCYQGGESGEGVTAVADLSAPLAERPTVRISSRAVVGGQTFYEVVDGTAAADGSITGEFRNLTGDTRFPATFVSVGEDFLALADDVLVEPADCDTLADDVTDIESNVAALEADGSGDVADIEFLPEETPMVWNVDADGEVFGRTRPGLDEEIVRTYQRGDTILFGTGRRATADDVTWVEIDGAPDAATGPTWWVQEAVLVVVGPAEQFQEGGVTTLPDVEASAWFTINMVDGRDQPGFVNDPSSTFPAQSYLIATGARAIADEMEWIEIDRADGQGRAWVLVEELVIPVTVDGGDSFAFTSPDGTIACVLSDLSASCWIGDKEWEIQQPTHDADCAVSDWGNAVEVTADRSFFPCYTDLVWDLAADALDYGLVVEVGRFRCQSAEGGVACRNDSGQGFVLSRSEVDTFDL